MKIKLIAAAAALLLTTTAQASIVTFNTSINVPENIEGVYIDLATGVTGTSRFTGWDFNPYAQISALYFYWGGNEALGGGAAADIAGPYYNLSAGDVVSSATIFSTFVAPTDAFRSTGTHILGFKFFNEATSGFNYGYLTMTNVGATGFPATITGWSFDNSGAAITVGATAAAVPEPASWAMMIGGLGLVGASMRRRAAKVSFA